MQRIIDIKWKVSDVRNQSRKNLALYETDTRYSSILKFRNNETNELVSIELTNYKFNFKLSEVKHCIGYYKNGEYVSCPVSNIIQSSTYTQCAYCEKIQGFKSAFLFGGEPNDEMKEYLAQKHFIYLAYFEPGIIKVGTAAESRKYLRPIEQDALAYLYIAESDGFNIQKLEHEISRQLGITENVRSSHKLKYLGVKSNGERVMNILMEKYNLIYSHFSSNKNFRNWLFEKDQLEVVSLINNPEIFYPEKEVHLQKELYVVGDFKGIRGRYLIIENDGEYFTFDIRTLVGRDIENYLDDWRYNIFKPEQIGFDL